MRAPDEVAERVCWSWNCLHTAIRYTGHGVVFDISVAIFGGTTPLLAAALVSGMHRSVAPAIYSC